MSDKICNIDEKVISIEEKFTKEIEIFFKKIEILDIKISIVWKMSTVISITENTWKSRRNELTRMQDKFEAILHWNINKNKITWKEYPKSLECIQSKDHS